MTSTKKSKPKGKQEPGSKPQKEKKIASAKSAAAATATATASATAASRHGTAATEAGDAPRNVTLITTGYRTRVREEGKPYAAFQDGWTPKSQSALHEEWEKRIEKIKEQDWVPGAGEHGIFSRQFGDQCVQLADPENTYAISTGLGLVNLSGMYPQYDLGVLEADIRNFDDIDKKLISDKQWWMFVCGLGGHSIFDTTMEAIKRGHRVVWAATGLNFFALKLDTVRIAELPPDQLATVRQHLRIVGPELDPVIHPKLLPCVMPYDRPGLDRCVPGSRANGVRRAAFLLQHVSPTPTNGHSSPREDAERMMAAFRDESFAPLDYRAPTQAAGDNPKHQQISDEEATRLVRDTYIDLIGTDAFRISRMMREDGYWVRQEKIEEILAALAKATASSSSTASAGGGSSGSGKKASTTSKSGKSKSASSAPAPASKSRKKSQASPASSASNGNGVHRDAGTHDDDDVAEDDGSSNGSGFVERDDDRDVA